MDILAAFLGQNFGWRRGWTHGVLALALWPFVLTGIMMVWHRFGRSTKATGPPLLPVELLWMSAVAVATHPFLDYLNNYGLRWLMPFRDRWYYGDTLFIVDPWMYLLLGLAVALARRGRDGRAARTGLALASVYIGLMMISSQIGRAMVRRDLRTSDPRVPLPRFMVTPVPVNPFVKQVVIDRGDRYQVGELRLLSGSVRLHDSVAKHLLDPAARLALQAPQAGPFLHWSRLPFAVLVPQGEATTVRLHDLRYSNGRGGSWAMVSVRVPVSTPGGH